MGPLRRSAAVLSAAVVAPLLGLAWLARPKWRAGVGERLGRFPRPETPGAIWIHAASVGEAAASLRLIDELTKRGRPVFASTTTETGRSLLSEARPKLPIRLAPLDHPLAVAAALDRVRPAALVMIETELWPSLIAGAHRRAIPVLVGSGRLSDRSFPRYRRLRRLFGPTLSRLATVGARSEEDARRFAALGVPAERILVTGDLKLEPSALAPCPPDLAAALGPAPALVAGSVHPTEVVTVCEAFARVQADGLDASLVLAPRHPERFGDTARALDHAGLPWQRRSALPAKTLAAGEVLLLDSVGELAALYGRAVSTFVGGSLVEGIGGHNVLEPVFAGRPVCFGPHTGNAREAVGLVLASKAGECVCNAEELARAWSDALREPEVATARGVAGRSALAPHEGAASRTADCIEALLGVRAAEATS